MELTGTAYLIGQTESIGNNGFTKRLLVVETSEQYPQKVPVNFVKDKTALLDRIQQGQPVTVSINIRGNEHGGKFYADIQGWKIQ